LAGPLNLSDADLKGFEALEPGRYNATVFEMSMDAVKNTSGQGKLPAGTPMVKIQWRLTEDNQDSGGNSLENRRVFSTYPIPPKEYDPKKAATMKGILARVFIALGDEEKDVLNNKFDPDFEDYLGREAVITVSRTEKRTADGQVVPDEWNNRVTGVKPAGSGIGGERGLL
jgi:hypothetical protein